MEKRGRVLDRTVLVSSPASLPISRADPVVRGGRRRCVRHNGEPWIRAQARTAVDGRSRVRPGRWLDETARFFDFLRVELDAKMARWKEQEGR
jgi:hypothetical protein